MSGTIACKIRAKMDIALATVRRGFMTVGDAINIFSGYLDGMADAGAITQNEHNLLKDEFSDIVLHLEDDYYD